MMHYDTHGNVVKKLPINTKKNRIEIIDIGGLQ